MFLRDAEIQLLINSGHVRGVRSVHDPDARDSPIQPCSLDLTIGRIFVPGVPANDLGGAANARFSHTLGVGETVVVETHESFHLPSDVGAFGFPPTTISNVGVLVTNLGHIDPGYDGKIKFTLVNMGRKSYSLQTGQNIYTTLFFKLTYGVRADYRQRSQASGPARSIQRMDELLDSLPSDFLDVDKRADDAAKKAVSEELKNPYRVAIGTFVAMILVVGGNFLITQNQTADLRAEIQDYKLAIDRQLAIEATARSAKESAEATRNGLADLKNEVRELASRIAAPRK
jgi:dCTP deaminase